MAQIPINVGETVADRLRLGFDIRLASNGLSPDLSQAGQQPQVSIDGGAWTGAAKIGTLSAVGFGKYTADLDPSAAAAVAHIKSRFQAGTSAETPGDTAQVSVSASPVGANTINISVEDQDSNPVPGFRADIWDAAETELLWQVPDTNLDGIITIQVDDATYKVYLVKTKFNADTAPETLVVSGNASVTYTGVIFTVPASSDPTQCTVYGTLRKTEGGAVWAGERISFYATGDGVVDANVQGNCIGQVITDAAGGFEIDLPRLASVLCITTALGPVNTTFSVTKVIPDLAGATFDAVFRS